ncbi:MAG: IPTL-CTERM sorting domain-containing protein [Acidobacteriota bacterium]|nr:IPTL-CTERM sorting domain-containing protein [Acidobacteriota bacterium]
MLGRKTASVVGIALGIACGILVAGAAGWAAPVEAQTLVTPVDPAGWLIGPFGTPPPTDFVEGPDAPPFGVGSFETEIEVAASKIILGRNDYHDLPLSDLTALSFWTYIDPAATNTNNWYINLYLDADGDGTYETRLDYVPPSGMVMQGVWQFWDAFLGTYQVSTGGTSTLADFLVANPDARFNAFNDPMALAVRWNMGDTASNYVGFLGNLDGVRIAHASVGDTTWDFDLEPDAPTVEIPTLSTLSLALLAGLLALAAAFLLRRRTARQR